MAESEQGTFPVGTHLGAYVLDHCVGSGAMGEVYQGHHSGLGKRVAIKLLQRHVAHNASIRARFLREGKTASLLQHPHVVQVTDVGEQEGTPYLVMEYLEGEPLSRMLKRERRQEIAPLVDLMLPIIDAVSVAHGKGVIHRDLKPDNVFLTLTRSGDYHPKVLDFGISKLLNDCSDPMLTGTQAVLGTPHYMAPEQALQGRDVDGRADQYSLGVMLYEGVTGQTPHHDTDSLARLVVAISTGQFDPPSSVRPDLPPEFEAIIMRAMARQPEDRFPSVAALGAALLPFASERGRAAWEPVFLGGARAPNGIASARRVESSRSPSRSSAPATKRPTTAGAGAVTASLTPLTKRSTLSA
jgi:serine/threonine protein kinase